MGKLHYMAITSLDGYVADREGRFDWSMPDPQVHDYVTELQRPVGTYLYGRRLYDVMAAWETMDTPPELPWLLDFATVWRAAEKVVYSTTLEEVSSARTRIEREFDPAAIRRMKEDSAQDITIGGATLAGQALKAGLVDECHLFLTPHLVGGGLRALPDDVRLDLELLGQHDFGNGVLYVRYGIL